MNEFTALIFLFIIVGLLLNIRSHLITTEDLAHRILKHIVDKQE